MRGRESVSNYRICPHCGANLDPGEVCDCQKSMTEEFRSIIEALSDDERDELLYVCKLYITGEKTFEECKKIIAARGAANTTDGKAANCHLWGASI